jgi:uncharacterized membrane protein YkgB
MPQPDDLREELRMIRERNARVELDKAWETSTTRRAAIAIGTYFVVLLFLLIIGASEPYLAALVPAVGFLLSTLTLPFLKNHWMKRR